MDSPTVYTLTGINDMIFTGKIFEEHLLQLQEFFNWHLQTDLMMQPKKCQFLKQEVQYLGHIVSKDDICPNQ